MNQFKAPGMQGLARKRLDGCVLFVRQSVFGFELATINRVAHDGVSECRAVDPDLVGASGPRTGGEERHLPGLFQAGCLGFAGRHGFHIGGYGRKDGRASKTVTEYVHSRMPFCQRRVKSFLLDL